jgi:hypothetical protein
MDRTGRVLVGCASAAGSTQAIAERIADVLTGAGLTVVCRPSMPSADRPGTLDPRLGNGVAMSRPAAHMLKLQRSKGTEGP